jgi:signal transduction histidine kinase
MAQNSRKSERGGKLASDESRTALRERVKELTCLYGISTLAERADLPLPDLLHRIAELLPPAWQFPAIASARISLDGQTCATPGFDERHERQTSPVLVRGEERGAVEVCYSEETQELDEGPFLTWERNLIDAVARKIALLVERHETREEQARLREQLLHADRLATIGQLAGGVAHELNEPLGNICGFAELCLEHPELPEQAVQDLERIIRASLHAREIIQRLLLFARKTPPKRCETDVNELVEKALSLFKGRLSTAGIELRVDLDMELPQVVLDPGQINQVLVNLVVNAIQAMPSGGVLTVSSCALGSELSVAVQDTGSGIHEELLPQIFLPFFTTKDVREGTGLGLAVVHGIITSHHGRVEVQSEPGQGARFDLRVPLEPPEGEKGDGADDCIVP